MYLQTGFTNVGALHGMVPTVLTRSILTTLNSLLGALSTGTLACSSV